MSRLSILALALAFASCSRPVAPGHVRLVLDHSQRVSLGLFAEDGHLVSQPLIAATLVAGTHEIDCRTRGVPPGSWTWRAIAFTPPTLDRLALVGGGVKDFAPGENIAGGDAGPPCAVAADEHAAFLGWRSSRSGPEVVACEPGGRVLWGHHHGPKTSGVRGLAADGGAVFVLASGRDSELYRLDAQTGEPLPWVGRPKRELAIKALWGSDAKSQPSRADYITAKNGRLYVTFAVDQFIAVLDGKTGAYLTTMTGPQPGPMAFSITPMRDPQTNELKVIDFGVAAISGNGLAYFLMEHEPPWVMVSTTRWLQPDEKIAALALHGDTMKTSQVTIYTALAEPHPQIQLRPAEAAEGFSVAVGAPEGRAESGPWQPDALREIRSIAVDATGQLWVAETGEKFGRFTVWKTEGKQGMLLREIFGPLDPATLRVNETNPLEFTLGGWRWQIDPEKHTATCLERLGDNPLPAPSPVTADLTDPSGLILWSPPLEEREAWSIHRGKDHRDFAIKRDAGVEVFALHGAETVHEIAHGSVVVPKP